MLNVSKFKRFDKDLYAENDSQCKAKVEELLKNSNYRVVENEKKMGVDLHIYAGDVHIGNLEVERKLVWKAVDAKKFPFPTVNFPYRKKKFTEGEKKTIFLMFNNDFSSYLTVTEQNLLASPVNMVRNKYVRYGEQFFQVPTTLISMNKLTTELKKMEKLNVTSK